MLTRMKRTSPHFPQTNFPLGAIQYRTILHFGQAGNFEFAGPALSGRGSGHANSPVGLNVASTIVDGGGELRDIWFSYAISAELDVFAVRVLRILRGFYKIALQWLTGHDVTPVAHDSHPAAEFGIDFIDSAPTALRPRRRFQQCNMVALDQHLDRTFKVHSSRKGSSHRVEAIAESELTSAGAPYPTPHFTSTLQRFVSSHKVEGGDRSVRPELTANCKARRIVSMLNSESAGIPNANSAQCRLPAILTAAPGSLPAQS